MRNAHMGKKRIAVIVPKYGLVGGGERFVYEVTERIAHEQQFELHVLANRWKVAAESPVIFHKVPSISFPRFMRAFIFPWFAQRMVAAGGYDLIHSHDRIFKADIVSLHGFPHEQWIRDVRKKSPSLFDRGVIAVERCMIKNGVDTTFLPVSSLAMDSFHRTYPKLPGIWDIVPPGVDFTRFSSPSREECRTKIRKRHGIGDHDVLFLFVGMNFEVKGLEAIISGMAKAKKSRGDAKITLLVVGKGDKRKFTRIAVSLGIAESVVFAGIMENGIEQYYRAADVFVMLSAFDTFGMVVLEAMAAGLPSVISNTVGAKDLIENGVNGFIIQDCTNTAAVADNFSSLLDAERRHRLGEAAQSTAEKFSWEHLASRVVTVYQKHLTKKCSVGVTA